MICTLIHAVVEAGNSVNRDYATTNDSVAIDLGFLVCTTQFRVKIAYEWMLCVCLCVQEANNIRLCMNGSNLMWNGVLVL